MASTEKQPSQEMDVVASSHLIDAFLSDIVQQVKRDVGHMMQLVHQWDLQECAMSSDRDDESRLGPITIQNVDKYLDWFFTRQALYAKDCREMPTSEEDTQLIGQSMLPTTAELVAAIRIIIPAMLNMIRGAPGRHEVETAPPHVAGILSDTFEETDHISVAVSVDDRDEVDDVIVAEHFTKSQDGSKTSSSVSPTKITEAEIYEKDWGISSSISDEMLRTAVESEVDTSRPGEPEIYLETCKDISPATLDYREDEEILTTRVLPIHSIESPYDVGIQIPLDLKHTAPDIDVSTPTILVRDLSSLADLRKAGITAEEADTYQDSLKDFLKTSLTESSSDKDVVIASPSSFQSIESQIDDKTACTVFQVPVMLEIPDNVVRVRSPAEDIGSISSAMSELSWGKDSDSSFSQSITSQESGRTAFLSFSAPSTVEIPDDSSCETPLTLDAISLSSISTDNRVILEDTDSVEALKCASGTILILSKEAIDEKVTALSTIPSTEHQYMIESPSPSFTPPSSVIINVPVSHISQAMINEVPGATSENVVNVPAPEVPIAINEANRLLTGVNEIFQVSPIPLVVSEDGRDDINLETSSFSGSPTESDFLVLPSTTAIQTIQSIPLCITTAMQNRLLSVAAGKTDTLAEGMPFDDTEKQRFLSAEPDDVLDKVVPGTEVLTSLSFKSIDSRTTPLPPFAIITSSATTESISTSIAPTFPDSDLGVAAERIEAMPGWSTPTRSTSPAVSERTVEDEVSQTRPLTPATLPDTTPTIIYVSAEDLVKSLVGPQHPSETLPLPFLLGQSGLTGKAADLGAEALKDTCTTVLDIRHFVEKESAEETTPPPVTTTTTTPVYYSVSPSSSLSDGIPPSCIVYDRDASILEAKEILATAPKDSSLPLAPAEDHPKISLSIFTKEQQEVLEAASADSPVGTSIAIPDDILSSLSLAILDRVSSSTSNEVDRITSEDTSSGKMPTKDMQGYAVAIPELDWNAIAQDMGPSFLDIRKKESLSEPTITAATDDALPSTSTKVENLVDNFYTEILDKLPVVSRDSGPSALDVLQECLDAVSSSHSPRLQDTAIAATIASLAHTDPVLTDSNLSVITTDMLGKVLDAVTDNRLQTFNIELANQDLHVTKSPDDIQFESEADKYDITEKGRPSPLFSFQDSRILAHVPTSSSTPQSDDTQLRISPALLDSLLVADTKESEEMSTLVVADRPALTPLMALALNAHAITCVDPLTTNVTDDDLKASREYLGNILSAVSKEASYATTSDFIRELSVPLTSPMLDGITEVAEEIKVDTLFPDEHLGSSAYTQIIFPVASTCYGDEEKVPLSSDPTVLQDSRTIPFSAFSPSARAVIVDKLPGFLPATSDDPQTKPTEHLIHPGLAFDRYKPGISPYVSEAVRKDSTEKMPPSSRKSPTEKSKKRVFSVFSSGLKSVKEKLRISSTASDINRDKVAESGLPSTIPKTSTCVPSSCFQVCKEKCCISSSVSESSKDEDPEKKLCSNRSTRSETGRKICSEVSFLPSSETADGDNLLTFAQALLNGFMKVDSEEKMSTPQVEDICCDALRKSCNIGLARSDPVKDINLSDSRSSSIQNYESHCRSISPVKPPATISALTDSTLPIIRPSELDGVLADAKIDSTDSDLEVDNCCGTFQRLCFPSVPRDLAMTEGPGTSLRNQKKIAPHDCSTPSTTANSKARSFAQALSVRVSVRSLCSRSDKK